MTRPEDSAREALRQCARGTLSANMALMRLCLHMPTHDESRKMLEAAIGRVEGDERERLQALAALWRETPCSFETIKAVIDAGSRAAASNDDRIARCAAVFDDAATLSPAASVALYSLGREDLLNAATEEVVSYLQRECFFDHDSSILDFGCGTGRFTAALAPLASRLVGIDISQEMLGRAHERCKERSNIALLRGFGRGLQFFGDESFNLALAVDVFPYLVEAGDDVLRANLDDLHRVLRIRGRLIIINFSYRGDEFDRSELRLLAQAAGFRPRLSGVRPFRSWDGAVFELLRI